MENLKVALASAKIKYTENTPLAPKTTFKIGSTACIFTAPETLEQFCHALEIIKASKVPFYILGGGSNTVFPDSPYNGVIISTENLKEITMTTVGDTAYVTCQAGTPMAAFITFCTANNLSGVEQFAGLPGSVGGAVYMNARCFDKSISEVFYSAEYISPLAEKSQIETLDYVPVQWAYKKSPFQPAEGSGAASKPHKYVLSATFRLSALPASHTSAQKAIEEKCKYYIAERKDKGHFKYPSAGSVFKNNRAFGKPSGQLIDEAGVRGLKIGGGQIAPFHGNFIINIDHASQKDIKELVAAAQKAVFDKFGFTLEPEIIFL